MSKVTVGQVYEIDKSEKKYLNGSIWRITHFDEMENAWNAQCIFGYLYGRIGTFAAGYLEGDGRVVKLINDEVEEKEHGLF